MMILVVNGTSLVASLLGVPFGGTAARRSQGPSLRPPSPEVSPGLGLGLVVPSLPPPQTCAVWYIVRYIIWSFICGVGSMVYSMVYSMVFYMWPLGNGAVWYIVWYIVWSFICGIWGSFRRFGAFVKCFFGVRLSTYY